MGLPVAVDPAFDDLDLIEVCGIGILHCLHHKGGCIAGRFGEVTSHRYAIAIANGLKIGAVYAVGFVVPPAKKAQYDSRAGGGVNLASLHAREEVLASIGWRPYRCETRRAQLPVGVEACHA